VLTLKNISVRSLLFLLIASLFFAEPSQGTEFCVVQMPHYWVIGADSDESTSGNDNSKAVDKIAQYGKFVVLRYGVEGKLGSPDRSFDIDAAIADVVRSNKTQEKIYTALTVLFDGVMVRMMNRHNEEKAAGTAQSDSWFMQKFSMGFVLLSVKDSKPLIDNYRIFFNSTITATIPSVSPQVELARQLYKPAAFSVPFFRSSPINVESDPDGAVRYLISNPIFMDGVGPPYVVKHFDGDELLTIEEKSVSIK
jgi:hypothetical protein